MFVKLEGGKVINGHIGNREINILFITDIIYDDNNVLKVVFKRGTHADLNILFESLEAKEKFIKAVKNEPVTETKTSKK